MNKWLIKFRGSEWYANCDDEAVDCRDEAYEYCSLEEARFSVNEILLFDKDDRVDLVKDNGKPYVVRITCKPPANTKKACAKALKHNEFIVVYMKRDGARESDIMYGNNSVQDAIDAWAEDHEDLRVSDIVSVTSVA